jgi:hypothetical protein
MSTLHKKLYLEIKRNDKLDENNKNKKVGCLEANIGENELLL